MRKTFAAVVLLLIPAFFVTGYASIDDKQEIITLARRYTDEAVFNEAVVAKHVSPTKPKHIALVKDGEANPLVIDQVKVKVDGARATLMSRLVFSGRRANGETYQHVKSWVVEFVKQGGQWQVGRARISEIGK